MDRIFENLEEKKNKRNKKKLELRLDFEEKDEYIPNKKLKIIFPILKHHQNKLRRRLILIY